MEDVTLEQPQKYPTFNIDLNFI